MARTVVPKPPLNPPLLGPPTERLLLATACAAGLALRLPWLLAGAPALLGRHGSDDLFYFTQVAQHVATGGGLSFDGLNATNGVQPLFMLILTPFAPAFEGRPLLATRVVLWLVTAFTMATAWLLPSLGQALCGGARRGRWAGVVAGCLWVMHPLVLDTTFEGTEAALAALCWVLSLRAWAGGASAPRLGAILAVGVLARVDHLVLALLTAWRRIFAWPVILGPLAVWSVVAALATGSPVPDSGAAKRLHGERIFALEHGLDVEAPPAFAAPAARLAELARGVLSVPRRAPVAAASILLFGVLAAARRETSITRALLRGGWPLFAGGLALVVAYLVYLHSLRSWYLVPLMLGSAMLGSALLVDLFGQRRRIAAAALAVLGATWLHASAAPRDHWGDSYLRAAERVAELTPPGSRIGAFNAGIQGAWAAGGRRVINLDGVVNHGALEALREVKLDEYVEEQRIGWLVDHDITVSFYERAGAHGLRERLRLLDRIEIPGRPEAWIGVWRVSAGIRR